MAMTILKMSLSAAVLISVIVVIRALALHKLPKRTFLALWGVALCRLLIPASIPSRLSIYTLADMLKDTFIKTSAPIALLNAAELPGTWAVSDMVNPALENTVNASVSSVMAIWIMGLLACVLFFLVTHLRCRRDYKTALPIDSEFTAKWLHEHPAKRKVTIRQSDKIAAPLTYGIFRPVVLLPKTTDWTDETSLRYILTHEYVHIRRFDILLKWLLAASLCVHWFNPFVWVMYVLANRDIELSCDETVVRTFGETMKSAYALTLIGLEEKKSRLTPLVNNFSKYAIEERINAIMRMKKATLFGMVMAFTLVFGTILTAFAAPAAAIEADESKGYDRYDPKSYYEEGEAVFIGTFKEQDKYNPCDKEGNPILVKRIIIDEQGKVTAVVPVENQLPENIIPDMTSTFIAVNGYEHIYELRSDSPLPHYVFRQININAPSAWVAVIPLEWQIK
jgi:bla regulator protein BlaR1